MEAWERGWIAAPERLTELASLREAFLGQDNKPSRQWMLECMTTTSVLLKQANGFEDWVDALTTLTLAMWQAGYEAAPKLEFVLPEGAGE